MLKDLAGNGFHLDIVGSLSMFLLATVEPRSRYEGLHCKWPFGQNDADDESACPGATESEDGETECEDEDPEGGAEDGESESEDGETEGEDGKTGDEFPSLICDRACQCEADSEDGQTDHELPPLVCHRAIQCEADSKDGQTEHEPPPPPLSLVRDALSAGSSVVVHCKHAFHRSPALVAALAAGGFAGPAPPEDEGSEAEDSGEPLFKVRKC